MENSSVADFINHALRLSESGRYGDARGRLDRAGAIIRQQEDAALLARVDEARARVFLAESKYGEARCVIERAVETLERAREEIKATDVSVEGFNVGVNDGEAAGQTVAHAHVHLIPRRPGDVEDPRGGVRHLMPFKGYY